jgi:kojibiose phosphorylase
VEKIVSIYTSRDVEDAAQAAWTAIEDAPGYASLLASHEAAWAEVWRGSDVVIEGDPDAQLAVRYNLFQTLIAAPRRDERASIPAKSLSGFGYRGHIFWDTEIYVLPLFTFTQPELARNLLSYRYHTLPGARRKAASNGFQGAMFAWESAATGEEVTPKVVPDPLGEELVRIWTGEREQHISADVTYAVWQYWWATGDDEWMRKGGAQIVLETALLWASRVEYDAERGRYELTDVIGPDEYHERVDNNAFTNRMVQWHMHVALQVVAWLRGRHPDRARSLEHELGLTPEKLAQWADIAERMYVPYDAERGLIEQFDGFFELEGVNLHDYEPRSQSMQAVLGIEGVNRAQVLKQADVLMLLYMLGDAYSQRTLQTNWDYYAPRTDHTYGSSLDPAIHAILACSLDRPQEAYAHLMRAALVDLSDTRGNTADGIHAASAGAIWPVLAFGFAGIQMGRGGPVANPVLPDHWTRLKLRLLHLGKWYDFDLGPDASSRDTHGTVDIRGVILDLDGVLADTSEYHYLAWKRLADEEGIPFQREDNEALRGVSRRQSLMRLLGGREVSETEIRKMMARKNDYYQEFIRGLTPDNLMNSW